MVGLPSFGGGDISIDVIFPPLNGGCGVAGKPKLISVAPNLWGISEVALLGEFGEIWANLRGF